MSVEDHGIEAIRKAAEPMTSGDKSDYRIKTTSYDALGNEGTTINSVQAVTGKDGIDSGTNTLQMISYEHHQIHGGDHFFISGFETLNTGISVDFALTTPDTTKRLHMLFEVQGQSRTEMLVYQGATITGGTATDAINNDRNSSKTSVATIVKNPTVNTTGNLIFSQSRGREGASPQQADNAGYFTRDKEIILKQNTIYLFRITSRDDSNIVSYLGEWYEHTRRDA